MAAALALGALRCGQWPTFSITLSVQLGSVRCRYSPTASGRDDVVAALQDERRRLQPRQVRAVVGQEGDARELLGDLRVGAAEAVGQLHAELRLVGRAHDGRRHVAGPAQVVALQRLEQRLDVRRARSRRRSRRR